MYSDGSVNAGEGMAAAWLYRGAHYADRVSLRGEWSGAECAELCGIVGAMVYVLQRRDLAVASVVFHGDNENSLCHLDGKAPVKDAGWLLYPAILLGRALVETLRARGTEVSFLHVGRDCDPAHKLAKQERRMRFEKWWNPASDRWVLPQEFRQAFKDVERNQVYSKRISFLRENLQDRYTLPEQVLEYFRKFS